MHGIPSRKKLALAVSTGRLILLMSHSISCCSDLLIAGSYFASFCDVLVSNGRTSK